jgi:hypothetical protein
MDCPLVVVLFARQYPTIDSDAFGDFSGQSALGCKLGFLERGEIMK